MITVRPLWSLTSEPRARDLRLRMRLMWVHQWPVPLALLSCENERLRSTQVEEVQKDHEYHR
jgi:hypothetical protein